MKSFWLTIKETLEVVLIALVTVFIIRHFLVQPFLVSGASMEPNFEDGDYLLVDEISYRFREPQRGEVIVFRYPKNLSTYFIKRVIGLPGDTIEIQAGTIYVNDKLLKEDYLSDALRSRDNLVMKLKSDEYFVMGDNRSHSFDSRNWGPLPKKNVVGLARTRIFPFHELAYFQYNTNFAN